MHSPASVPTELSPEPTILLVSDATTVVIFLCVILGLFFSLSSLVLVAVVRIRLQRGLSAGIGLGQGRQTHADVSFLVIVDVLDRRCGWGPASDASVRLFKRRRFLSVQQWRGRDVDICSKQCYQAKYAVFGICVGDSCRLGSPVTELTVPSGWGRNIVRMDELGVTELCEREVRAVIFVRCLRRGLLQQQRAREPESSSELQRDLDLCARELGSEWICVSHTSACLEP